MKPIKTLFISFRASRELKEKLYTDSNRFHYPSVSSYLCDLIKGGLAISDPLDMRLQLIEQKIDVLSVNQKTYNESFFSRLMFLLKRVLVIYKVVANVFTRVLSLSGGEITESNLNEANSFIQTEFERIEKRFESDIEW